MINDWQNHSNAKYIDMMVAGWPDHLTWEYNTVSDKERQRAVDAMLSRVWKSHDRSLLWDKIRDHVLQTLMRFDGGKLPPNPAWRAIHDAGLALVSTDNCGYMIESDPKEIEVLANLGVVEAIMLLPICTVYQGMKNG